MSEKSLVAEMQQVQLAIELIELGARLQVLESETELSRSRLVKLYKEVRGVSPPKGMLPFSTDWFMTWRPNIHSSLFYNYFRQLEQSGELERIERFIKAYRLYMDQVHQSSDEEDVVLDMTRAWTLIRFFESDMLELAPCRQCGGRFVVHAYSPVKDYVCGICHPPSRAGKTMRDKRQRKSG